MLLLNPAILLFSAGVTAIASPHVVVKDAKIPMPFVARLNTSGHTIAEMDRARATHFFASRKSRRNVNLLADSLPITNQAVAYTAEVGVGNPPTNYTLLIDIGSANTWVGSRKPYIQTKTSQNTSSSFSVTYSLGTVNGTEFNDTVILSDDLIIPGQGVGVVSSALAFGAVDGILGFGPTNLTEGTVAGMSNVPTITDNLFRLGKISQKVLSVYFAPTSSLNITNGELTVGGVDTTKFTGDLTFTPITSTSPASEYFGFDQFITYGATGLFIVDFTAGIVDTGTALVSLPTDSFNLYAQVVGAQIDQITGLLSISPSKYASLESLFFHIGNSTFEFTRNAQTWPRALNTAIGGSESQIYLVVGDIGSQRGGGLDFICGMVFLERFYSVFDTSEKRIGFAMTAHTLDQTN